MLILNPLNPRVVAILGFIFTVLSKVSAYPQDPQNPQPGLKLDDSQSPFGLVTRSFPTHGTPTTTVELALTALSTPSSTLSSTSGASTLTTSLSFLSFSSFSSFSSVDPVLTSRSSLNPTISIRPNLVPLDSPLELTATPLSTASTPLTPQLSEQVPFSPPLDSQTASLPTELPSPSTDARVLSPQHSTTTVNNNFVIGMVFASMFAFMILSLSSPNLARSGSSSNSPATEKRKWMRGTLFDVETGMVENLAGIGRAAPMEPEKRGCRGGRRITALHMRSPSFKGTTLSASERPKAIIASAGKPSMEGYKPSKPSPLGQI